MTSPSDQPSTGWCVPACGLTPKILMVDRSFRICTLQNNEPGWECRCTRFSSEVNTRTMKRSFKDILSSIYTAKIGVIPNRTSILMVQRWRCYKMGPSNGGGCFVGDERIGISFRFIQFSNSHFVMKTWIKVSSASISRRQVVICITKEVSSFNILRLYAGLAIRTMPLTFKEKSSNFAFETLLLRCFIIPRSSATILGKRTNRYLFVLVCFGRRSGGCAFSILHTRRSAGVAVKNGFRHVSMLRIVVQVLGALMFVGRDRNKVLPFRNAQVQRSVEDESPRLLLGKQEAS